MPPRTAGLEKDGGKMVWVKNDQGGIRPNPIKTGIDNGTNIEVVSGLKEGDEVIISMSGDGSTTPKKTTEGPRGPFPF
jgi:multidrug efflux pump subunit AcrA (membrane-fusion protein)